MLKWRPSALLAACLRHAIFELSQGKDLQVVSDTASRYFLTAARSPGLDAPGVDTYLLTMDFIAIIKNVLEYFSRGPLLKLYEIPNVELDTLTGERVFWRFLCLLDESGVLHHFDFVDHIPKDPTEDLHSWEIFGDIAAANAPMVLHYVAIGRRLGDHQDSPWCKILAHPKVANIFRFNKVSGEDLKGTWKPVYYNDNAKNTTRHWVDWMQKEGAHIPLVRNIQVRQVSDSDLKGFLRDVAYEVSAMGELAATSSPLSLPMSRSRCDKPYICEHQDYCYSRGKETLDSIGLYKKKVVKEGVS